MQLCKPPPPRRHHSRTQGRASDRSWLFTLTTQPGSPPPLDATLSCTCHTQHQPYGIWVSGSRRTRLQWALWTAARDAIRGYPRGLFGLFHSLTTRSITTGTARRRGREEGGLWGARRASADRLFYPVLVPKPGLRYQLGPAKLSMGRAGQDDAGVRQETQAADAGTPPPALSTASCCTVCLQWHSAHSIRPPSPANSAHVNVIILSFHLPTAAE